MRVLTVEEAGFVSGGIKNPYVTPARPHDAPSPEERAWQTIELFALRQRVADEIAAEAGGLLIDNATGKVFANAALETLEKFMKGTAKEGQQAAAELFGSEIAAQLLDGKQTVKGMQDLRNRIGALLLEYHNRIGDQARYGSGFN